MNDWLFRLFWLCGVAAVAAAAQWLFGLPMLVGVPVIAIALMANGWLAEWEDRRPGGFYNPKEEPDE